MYMSVAAKLAAKASGCETAPSSNQFCFEYLQKTEDISIVFPDIPALAMVYEKRKLFVTPALDMPYGRCYS